MQKSVYPPKKYSAVSFFARPLDFLMSMKTIATTEKEPHAGCSRAERIAIASHKRELHSLLSHEFRTPLASIRGALGLVVSGKLGPLSEKGSRMVDVALSSTDRIALLLDELLGDGTMEEEPERPQ